MLLEQDAVYKVGPKIGGVLDVNIGGGHHHGYTFSTGADHGGDNQRFLFFPADSGDHYTICPMIGGVLDVNIGGGHHHGYVFSTPHYHGGTNQVFRLEKVGDFYQLHPRLGGTLDVNIGGGHHHGYVFSTPNNHQGDNQVFEFAIVDRVSVPPLSDPMVGPGEIGDVPRITNFVDIPPEESAHYRIGEIHIPHYSVTDDIPMAQQVKSTPYYKLTRTQFWRRMYLHGKSVAAEERHEIRTKIGITQQKTVQLQRTLKTSVGADFGFSYKPFSGKVKADMSQTLRVTETTTETRLEETVTSKNIVFPEGKKVRKALWLMIDKYTLARADGTIALDWELKREDYMIEDAYMEDL